MGLVILTCGESGEKAAERLENLNFRLRPAVVNDCNGRNDADLILIKAKSVAHLNLLLDQLIAIASESKRIALIEKKKLFHLNLALLDDFIPLPLNEEDSSLRLNFHLKKWRNENSRLQHHGLMLNLENYEATVEGKLLELTYKEFELLRFLMSRSEKVFSRPQLLEEIWQYDYISGTRTVDVHIRRLRAKLGPKYGYNIQTVRNVGYRFGR